MSTMAAVVALSVAGTAVSAVGTIARGQAEARAAAYRAKALEINAKEERAAAQHQAMEEDRQTRYALSKVQAQSAGSGFGADDTSVQNLSGDIARYGSLKAQMAQYGGDSRAEGLRAQANATRLSGDAALTGAYYGAAGSLLSGFSSLYSKYRTYT